MEMQDFGTCFADVHVSEKGDSQRFLEGTGTPSTSTQMRKREKDSIIGKIGRTPEEKHGRSVHVRPYYTDEKKLDEIARETGEGKAALVRRMIHFALSEKQQVFAANRCQQNLDWLIKSSRQNEVIAGATGERLDDILERIECLESKLETVSEITRCATVFLRELYTLSSVAVSSQNLILTKVLEFLSPNAVEREQSANIADGAMANLITHAIHDLDKFAVFHGIPSDDKTARNVYLGTKIKVLWDRIAATPSKTMEQEHPPQ